MAPSSEAWLFLYTLALRSAHEESSLPESDRCKMVSHLCSQNWRACVQSCSNAIWVSVVLQAANLAEKGLASEGVHELVKRRCFVLSSQHSLK